jgi:hypothetical protein
MRPIRKGLFDSVGEGVDDCGVGVPVPDDLKLELASDGHCDGLAAGPDWWATGEGGR